MGEKGDVYLYPPNAPSDAEPWIEYSNARDIVTREVPVGAIEFRNNKGQRVTSTLPYVIVWEGRDR